MIDAHLAAQDRKDMAAKTSSRATSLAPIASIDRTNSIRKRSDSPAGENVSVDSHIVKRFSGDSLPPSEEIQRFSFKVSGGTVDSVTRIDSPAQNMAREVASSTAARKAMNFNLRAHGQQPRKMPPKYNAFSRKDTGQVSPSAQYDRTKAMSYALTWWASRNPDYPIAADEPTDCTNFASQILRAEGWENYAPDLYDDTNPNLFYYKEPSVWYYAAGFLPQPNSWTWSAANNLSNFPLYHEDRGEYKSDGIAQVGDLIFFDWNGDDAVDHVMVVSNVDSDGNESLTGHTNERWNYPLAWAIDDAFEEHGQYPGIWRLSPA